MGNQVTTRWVYSFGDGKAEGRADMKNLLGGKGANLAEMSNLGLPVPPGFTVTTDVCTYYYKHDRTYPSDLKDQVAEALATVERSIGAGFGDPENPLLVSVRSGARASMPGMMDTVLNLGLTDVTVQGLVKRSGDARFAYDSYRRFIQILGRRSITEFNYRYVDDPEAHIFVGVQLTGGEREKREIIGLLRAEGLPVQDMSDNEMAKLHVRHMVGGRVPGLRDELIYRFQFPERPGALLKFLDGLATDWNISLFHYRNHGADYGRVLAGIQVPEADRAIFRQRLAELGYPCWDETDNPAYRSFLDGGGRTIRAGKDPYPI